MARKFQLSQSQIKGEMQPSAAFHDVVGLRVASRAASPGGLNPQNGYRSISAILGQHFKKKGCGIAR
jgi:hypothetical protein